MHNTDSCQGLWLGLTDQAVHPVALSNCKPWFMSARTVPFGAGIIAVLLSGLSSRVCMLLTVSLITIMYPDPTHSIAATICSSKVRPPGRTCTSEQWCIFISSTYLYHSGLPPGEADRGDTKTFTLSMGTPSLRSSDNVFPHSSVGRSNDGMTNLKSMSVAFVVFRLSRQ